MAEIQGNVSKKGNRNWASGFLNSKGDKDEIASWKQELVMILHVFNVRSFGFAQHSLQQYPSRPNWQ